MYLNKAIIIGNLTRDPELKSLPSGIKVATVSVATNRVWKDQQGARQEATDYHNVVVFGRQAETVSQYMHKGSSILVEGRLQTRSWDSEGSKRYRTEIVADRIQFGPRSEGASGSGGSAGSSNASGSGHNSQGGSYSAQPNESATGQGQGAKGGGNEDMASIEYPEEDINADDIPF